MPTAPPVADAELAGFLERLPETAAINVRSLAHAWESAGGRLQVGRLTIRLLSGDGAGTGPFTAGTVHAPRAEQTHPGLELSRVLLESRGVDWLHWSDEFADLRHHGFDPSARFPTVVLDDRVTASELARLVTGLRDLAKMVD